MKKPYTRYLVTLMLCLASATAAIAENFATVSALSSGRWTKVRVDASGVYRIPYADLAAWGFGNPQEVSVCGYGSIERTPTLESAPDDLPPIPVMRGADALYFYAEGPSRLSPRGTGYDPTEHLNNFSRSSYYFITDRTDISSPEITETEFTATTGTTVDTHIVMDRRRFDDHHPFGAGAMMFSHDIKLNHPAISQTWKIAPGASNAEFSYRYIGFPSATAIVAPQVDFGGAGASDVSVAGIKGTNASNVEYVASDTHRYRLSGLADAVEVSVSDPTDKFDLLCVSDMTLRHDAPNTITRLPELWDFYSVWNGDVIAMNDAPEGLVIWDVSNPRHPQSLGQQRDDDNTLLVTANPTDAASSRIVLFTPDSSVPMPVFEGEVPNQNLHAITGAELLIVASDVAYDAALRLAEAHRQYQGMTVAVTRQQEIFNEFSSGAYHPNALRHMVMMLAGRGLRHLLIMGYGQNYPLKAGETIASSNAVTYHTEYTDEDRYNSKNHCSDMYFVLTADRTGTRITDPTVRLEINVGRATTRSAAEAEAFVDKCTAYLADPAAAGRTTEALFFAGYGDANQHLSSALRQANAFAEAYPYATVHQGHQVLFKSEGTTSKATLDYIKSSLSGQTRLVNYTGHSDFKLLGLNFSIAEEKTIKYGSYPLFITAGCRTGQFDTGTLSIGTSMLSDSNGPIALIGTTREVYMANNHVLNNRLVDAFVSATPDMTLGDIFTKALNSSHVFSSTSAARDQVINNCSYHFFGDPALPSYAPSGTVELKSVGGLAPNSRLIDTPSLKPVTLSGVVTVAGGKTTDTTFDGYVNLTIFAPARNRITDSPDTSDKNDGKKLIVTDDDEIYSAVADVRAGKWSLKVIPPLTDSIGANRIALHAVSNDRRVASGGAKAIRITDATGDTPVDDIEGPEIILTVDGLGPGEIEYASESPLLEVILSDTGSGPRIVRSGIGTVPCVKVDGKTIDKSGNSFRPVAEGTYRASLPLTDLSDGEHAVTVTASDIAGNTSTETIRFIVDRAAPAATLAADTDIARESVEFTLSLASGITPESTLLIRDSAGETVASLGGVTFPYTWDLRLADGTPAPDGTYRASVMYDTASRYGSTPEIQFTIVKK